MAGDHGVRVEEGHAGRAATPGLQVGVGKAFGVRGVDEHPRALVVRVDVVVGHGPEEAQIGQRLRGGLDLRVQRLVSGLGATDHLETQLRQRARQIQRQVGTLEGPQVVDPQHVDLACLEGRHLHRRVDQHPRDAAIEPVVGVQPLHLLLALRQHDVGAAQAPAVHPAVVPVRDEQRIGLAVAVVRDAKDQAPPVHPRESRGDGDLLAGATQVVDIGVCAAQRRPQPRQPRVEEAQHGHAPAQPVGLVQQDAVHARGVGLPVVGHHHRHLVAAPGQRPRQQRVLHLLAAHAVAAVGARQHGQVLQPDETHAQRARGRAAARSRRRHRGDRLGAPGQQGQGGQRHGGRHRHRVGAIQNSLTTSPVTRTGPWASVPASDCSAAIELAWRRASSSAAPQRSAMARASAP